MEIKPYEKNAKLHPQKQLKQLAEIVKEVGWRQPALVNQEGVLVAGHGRWQTWKEYGSEYGLKPIWIMDDTGKTIHGAPEETPLTKEQEAAYRLADNKLNESEWDMVLVVEELKLLSPEMVELTGFDTDLLLEDDEKDDTVPLLPETARSKPGDLYQLGPHKLLVGDSIKPEDVKKLMGEVTADMVFTDPPYNVNYSGSGENTSNKIENDNMDDESFDIFLEHAFKNYKDIMKLGAGAYIFHDSKTANQFESALNRAGFEIKTYLVWNKPSAGLGMGDYRRKHEPFFYACIKNSKPNFYGDRTHSTVVDFHKSEAALVAWAKREKQREAEGKTSIWTMKREPTADYIHPTQKPVELILYALKNSSKEGDVVVDLFLGSGTTMIACEKAGRVCYGMEMDPRYADVCVERYVDYTQNCEIIKNGIPETWINL